MKRTTWTTLWVCLVASLLLVPQVLAQNPTGTLKGRVTDDQGAGLPGVRVTATSPALQGERSTQTGGNGDYIIRGLPPGEYRVTYELEGFATSIQTTKMSAAQTQVNDIGMQLAAVAEEITVTSDVQVLSETNTVAQTTTGEELDKLPIDREPLDAVNLAPGVTDTGPSTAPSVLGGFSYENLFLVNGVSVNENIRGSFLPLFIEDAIEETTTTTAGVSAEYGRFAGGVVNVITKSGGNELSGSFRVNLTNDDWVSDSTDRIFDPNFQQVDDVSDITEATLGGPFWKDKIWFFAAGRDRVEASQDTTAITNLSYPTSDEEQRIEAKLTVSFTPSHSVIGSYLEIERTRAGSTFGTVLDLRSINNRTDPQDIKSGNYTGILTSNFFVEAQYSERFYEIATGFGGTPELTNGLPIEGTLLYDRPSGRTYHSSFFCGSCEPEIRNNENQLIKGSYFLTTDNAGSHDLTFGYDNFSDIRFSVNHQSGSDYQVWAERTVIDANNNIFPVVESGNSWILWWPPIGLDIAQETDFQTNSFYANDSWQLNDKWSFNIGVRYDENDGVDSSGALVADDSKVSPRLGFSYDVKGDGDLVVQGSYGTYVAAIANTGNVADGASTGGALALLLSTYGGPAINSTCGSGGPCTSTPDALATIFEWYYANGGTQDVNQVLSGMTTPPNLLFQCIPGATAVIREGLKSPSTDEITVGVTKRLGNKGLVRADLVLREWDDFYSQRNQPNDQVDLNGDGSGDADISQIGNFGNNILEREYFGVLLSARYRVTDKLTLAGNYTWSETEGNINGETSGSGPVSTSPNEYREYKDPAWNTPVGLLTSDQTHKFRIWGVYDIISNSRHNLNVSLLQNYFSGTPYGALGSVNPSPFVSNPGYATPPTSVNYYFTARDAFRTDSISRTDIGLNYTFRWNMFGKQFEVFLQPEVINVFDGDSILARREVTNVTDATDGAACPNSPTGSCQSFNPFTETPVENVHWVRSDDFGEPDEADDFQQPRTFRLSVGFRF